MLGSDMQKSREDVQPLMIANLLSDSERVKEDIQVSYTINNPKNKDVVGGAGETVAKKLVRKFSSNDKSLRKTVPSISDKIPKKLAQRAKGTTSINKPNPNPNSDIEAKLRSPYLDKVSLKSQSSKDDSKSCKSENQKQNDTLDKKFKSKLKKPSTKIPKRALESDNPPTESVCETQIKETVLAEDFKPERKLSTLLPTVEEPISEISEGIKTTATATSLNQAINCSLLERLQLGVKSYFSSRNSMICSDKNKKEGGNQTRAKVGTEVKEDARKTDPGFEFKNYLSVSKSGSLPDQLSLNSNLGGESNNFLSNNTQIRQNVKRRKYKNNMRIQIPRKGYFYRSSALSKTPEQPSPRESEWLDSKVFYKNDAKTEIPGMAPTGPQIPGFPIKKRNLNYFKSSVEADVESDESSCSGYSNLSAHFIDTIGNNGRRWTGKNSSLTDLTFDKEKQRNKIGGDCFDNHEMGTNSPSTYKVLTSCITSVLKDDELFKNLEITPVNLEKEKFESFSDESTKPLITSVPLSYTSSGSTIAGQTNATAVLMGDIDLHEELQNYLKAFNNFGVSKTRTKNTLNSNNLIKAQESEYYRKDENQRKLISTVSDCPEYCSSDDQEEERMESRLPRSQTQIPEIFKQILKKNSTDKALKKKTNNSIDDYEKIIPLDSYSTKMLKTTDPQTIYEESVPDSQQKETPSITHSGIDKKGLNLLDKMEIFYNVLQDCSSYKWKPRKSKTNLFTYLMPLLIKKRTNKNRNYELINYAKEISQRKGWQSFKERESVKLKMYVNMFQKIVKALTFRQISYLNKIISSWEMNSDELIRNYKAQKAFRSKNLIQPSGETLTSKKSTSTGFSSKSTEKPLKNLQTTMESFLNLKKSSDYSTLSALKGKVLVDVKLSGNEIQVKDLSYVNDEIPSRKKEDLQGRSELIIENVKKSQMNDVFYDQKPKQGKNINKTIVNINPEFYENRLKPQHSIWENSELPKTKKSIVTEQNFGNTFNVKDFIEPKDPIELHHDDTKRFGRKFQSPERNSGLAKTAKSDVDLKSNKIHKTPSGWTRSIFCYSSYHSPKNKLLKEGGIKEKKTGGLKVQKKKKKQRQNTTNGGVSKSTQNQRQKNDASCDFYNFEFLFSEAPRKKQYQTQSITNLILNDVANVCGVDTKSNQYVDRESFSLDLIHSESFLRKLSNVSILERDTKLLFQNDSDDKYRHMNWLEYNKNSKGLTTFYLTPEQYEKADLPNDDVVIVLRKKLPMNFQIPSVDKEDGCTPCEDYVPEVMKKKKKPKPEGKKFCSPVYKERKTKTRCQTCQFLSQQVSPPPKSIKENTVSTAKNKKSLFKKVNSENSKIFPRDGPAKNETFIKKQPKRENAKSEKKMDEEKQEDADNVSNMSVNLEDIPLEMLEALQRIFNKVEVLKQKKFASATQKKKNIGKKFFNLKRAKSFTLKIHCEKSKKKADPENKSMSLGSSKNSDIEVKNYESLFFDAVDADQNLEDEVPKELKGDKKLSESGSSSPKGCKKQLETSKSSKTLSEAKSEYLLSQISDCLVEGQISCSLLLLDTFLQKKGKNYLNKTFDLSEKNSENLIGTLERSTWQVLMILEALTQLVEKNYNENLKEYLQSTKDVVNKILILHINRLANYHKLKSGTEITENSENDANSFEIIKECLNNLGQMFNADEIQKRKNQITYPKVNKPDSRTIGSQNSDESMVLEIRKMKNKVVKELKSLEELFLVPEVSPTTDEDEDEEEDSSENERTPNEDWLHRTYGCMHLMQCLLKVWDTRMSLNAYPSGYLR